MSSRAERALTAAINLLLYPGRVQPTWLSRIGTLLIIVGLVLPIILAFPLLKDHLFCAVPSLRGITAEKREAIKNWCDFVALCSQVVLALMVGGIIFTDRIAGAWRTRAEKIQAELEQMSEAILKGEASTTIGRQLAGYMQQLETLKRGVTWFNLPVRLVRASSIAEHIYGVVLPDAYKILFSNLPPTAALLGIRLLVNFPGGYSGTRIFGVFVVMIASGALKTYLEYPPVC
jgi:hypothetical protein